MKNNLTIEIPDPQAINDETIHLPAHYEVCGNCRGTGSTVNPSIDSNGISNSEFDEDSDFREDYFAGKYDVPCCECDGRRVVLTVSLSELTIEQKQAWESHNEYLAESASIRRMHARGIQY